MITNSNFKIKMSIKPLYVSNGAVRDIKAVLNFTGTKDAYIDDKYMYVVADICGIKIHYFNTKEEAISESIKDGNHSIFHFDCKPSVGQRAKTLKIVLNCGNNAEKIQSKHSLSHWVHQPHNRRQSKINSIGEVDIKAKVITVVLGFNAEIVKTEVLLKKLNNDKLNNDKSDYCDIARRMPPSYKSMDLIRKKVGDSVFSPEEMLTSLRKGEFIQDGSEIYILSIDKLS